MALSDLFKITEFKDKISSLERDKNAFSAKNDVLSKLNEDNLAKISTLSRDNNQLKDELQMKLALKQLKPIELDAKISEKQAELDSINVKLEETDKKLSDLLTKINLKEQDYYELDAQVGDLEARNDMAGYGLPEPLYNFASSLDYKEKLDSIRQDQKFEIREGTAYECASDWLVNGSAVQGRRMIKRDIKALFRSFNNECTSAINKVSYSNYDRISTRIKKSFEQHNKMHQEYNLRILDTYLQLKLKELNLAYSFKKKKEEEKEELREQRAREREEATLQREIDAKRKNLNKEINHYDQAVSELTEKLSKSIDGDPELEAEIKKLKNKLASLQAKKSEVDYRESNATAGYVYVISNIGSFGKDIVKIGVTRRLEPLDRINELSSASVPFRFDVHALIFSSDAFALEAKLHQRFDRNRINKVNNRKEYFKISITEIEEELQKYKDVTVDFHESPEASEYRETLAISKQSVRDNNAAS